MTVRREFLERMLKKELLSLAKTQNVDPALIAEWLYEEFGPRTAPTWDKVERVILREDSVTARELAVFLAEAGVKDIEERWVRVVEEWGDMLKTRRRRLYHREP